MKICVAICTWNRARLLDLTLVEMRKLRIPPGVEWELLIVNNNCTDNTDEVIVRHRTHLPIQRLFEPEPGQSNARNRAVAAASGELILWTDDDVLVAPDWLSHYADAARRFEDASFFGGPIRPWFDGTPPIWLAAAWKTVSGAYAARDLGAEMFAFSPSHLPFGANFGVRTAVQRAYLYHPALGLRPGSNMRFDETQLLERMLADGHEGRWIPDAHVRHFIPRSRQTVRYLRQFYFGQGQYLGRMSFDDAYVARLLGRPRWLVRQAVTAEIRYRVRRAICRPEEWIEDLVNSSKLWGRLCPYI